MKCQFCATGQQGFKRNLTSFEIALQVQLILQEQNSKGEKTKVSFMGMGEPLLNLNEVIFAQESLSQNFPEMRFSLSTIGITQKIYELADRNNEMELQISLHAPNDFLREQIMPLTRNSPIKDVLNAAKFYSTKSKKPLRLNYMLLQGINDSNKEVKQLVKLLSTYPSKLKISSYSPIEGVLFKTCEIKEHMAFIEKLKFHGLNAYSFISSGTDIDGGCGQLKSKPNTGNIVN